MKVLLIFVICDVIFIILFYLFFPETKNKTLEELEAVFGDPVAETLEDAGKYIEEGEKDVSMTRHEYALEERKS